MTRNTATLFLILATASATALAGPYPVVDTGQDAIDSERSKAVDTESIAVDHR